MTNDQIDEVMRLSSVVAKATSQQVLAAHKGKNLPLNGYKVLTANQNLRNYLESIT